MWDWVWNRGSWRLFECPKPDWKDSRRHTRWDERPNLEVQLIRHGGGQFDLYPASMRDPKNATRLGRAYQGPAPAGVLRDAGIPVLPRRASIAAPKAVQRARDTAPGKGGMARPALGAVVDVASPKRGDDDDDAEVEDVEER